MEDNIEEKLQRKLLDVQNFKRVCDLRESLVPVCPGLYAIQIIDLNHLPEVFSQKLKAEGENLIYIGKASKSLRKRLWKQELHAQGHGTFFRSIGAVLGYLPERGSLKDKANQNNFTFKEADEEKIIAWISQNLSINYVPCPPECIALESQMIAEKCPIMNLQNNPCPFEPLKLLRQKCKEVAVGN